MHDAWHAGFWFLNFKYEENNDSTVSYRNKSAMGLELRTIIVVGLIRLWLY